ncbi:MAG: triose-phosphate isomerase [bacterium]
MKKPIIIANWKMNLNLAETIDLATKLKGRLQLDFTKEVVLCPHFVGLPKVGEIVKGSALHLGAQDTFWENSGPYTGEISPTVLQDIGCKYVIVGHSERRQYLSETYEMVNKKVKACLANKLVPILCIGETYEDRQNGMTDSVIFDQLSTALSDINLVDGEQIIIAYEPVWVIGSGHAVEPENVNHIFHVIRQTLVDMWPMSVVNGARLIYGGSVNADNVDGFLGVELLSGFLVGGAALSVDNFTNIVNKIKK